MFGGTKPTFGATTTGTGFGAFNNTTTSSPFGQSAFGKPTTSAFGAAPSFGTQQTAPSLFGSNAAQPQTSGLFGGASTSTAFGATTTTQAPFGNFSQPQQNTSIFGAGQTQTNNASLFGQPAATSAFGSAVKPGGLGTFGQTTAQPSTSLFGQSGVNTSTGAFGTFGQTAPATASVFGSTTTSAFGQPANAATGTNPGTSISKYQPTIGTDTLMKGGQPNSINTKLHCITAMKEYEGKSLEELRMEDYLTNRKGPQAGAAGAFGGFGATTQAATATGLFGATTQQSTGLFGQPAAGATENKGLFGTTNTFGQPATGGFGATATQPFGAKPFGAANTTAFGTTAADNSNPFGTKPAFGQTATPSLFGQNPATSTAPVFGQTGSGFGTGFGTNAGQQQQPSLFGQSVTDANKSAFGLGQASAGNTGFGAFGTTATSTATGGLFGAKTATGFGAPSAFGTTQANTGFQNFSLNNTNVGGGGLFNSNLNKTATSGFGAFGTNTSTAAPLNFNTGTGQTSLFGNTASKPGGLFGTTLGGASNTTGGGLFGQTAQSTFGLGNQNRGFGQTGDGTLNSLGGLPGMPQQQQQLAIHQQILSKVTSPYGDNPIFKDLKRIEDNDATRATNPAAQKAILENTNNSSQQFRISSNSSPSVVKVKPIGSAITKKSLFDGLEEFDASVETFNLKPNAKRLVLKPKNNNIVGVESGQQTSGLGSNVNVSQKQSTSGILSSNSNSNNNREDIRNESFTGHMQPDSIRSQSPITGAIEFSSNTNTSQTSSLDASRRESWLHPNNLEKVRQHNLNAGLESPHTHNNTLTELVPRKPLETYRNTSGVSRLSVSGVPENSFEDQSSVLSRRDTSGITVNDSISSNRSYVTDGKSILIEDSQAEYEEHPTGITLRRMGYYTIPSMDDLKSFLAEDGSCVVPNFTVGREGYGNVYFGKEIDVANLNLDEIVHFRNKEIIVYPDDDNKPPVGHGLNREAQVTLDQVWPLDKSKHEAIKDPQRLLEMDWESKLRRVCDKNETRFIEYRPETGSWVFRVKHFSKYGLNDSDEEEDIPTDPKKAKMVATAADTAKQKALTQAAVASAINNNDKMTLETLKIVQKVSEEAARALESKTSTNSGSYPMDESAEFMLMDKTQFFQNNGNIDFSMFDDQVFKQSINSPTASLAKDMGTDAHKLQLMKASFFIDDLENNKSAENPEFVQPYSNPNKLGGIFGKRLHDICDSSNSFCRETDSNSILGLRANLSEASSQVASNPSLTVIPRDAGTVVSNFKNQTQQTDKENFNTATSLPPLIVKPKVAAVKSLCSFVPFTKSLAFPLRLKWSADLGLYNSRRFKLGFGPQITLIVPTTRENLNQEINSKNLLDIAPIIFKSRGGNDYSPTVLQHLKISATQSYDNFKESIVDHLQIQLKNSQHQDVEGSECPFIKSDSGTELIVKHLDEAIKLINLGPLEEYAVSLWSLCLALWGDHDELEGRETTSHFVIMYRRNLLSEWLENTLTDKDLLTKTVSKNTYLEHLIDLIMCHKVTEACELAFNYDDVNLSLLISQLSSGPVVRQLMEDQLAAWNTEKADQFIKVERLKLFMFVAGISLMASNHGVVNCLEGIEWLKVLGLQLWYLCSPTSSITDALFAYDKSFKSEEFYSLPPTPLYTENLCRYNDKDTIYDLRYHLLQLFSKRSHPLESLLNPATHTSDPMDYRLSWLLLQTLEALGYRHCSELSESQLHVGFAAQLENNGLWEWAIFVLLHIKNKNQRELAVQNVLYRYVSVSKDVALNEKEKFVMNNLGVPEKWIDYAKAVKAGSIHNYHLQAKYLLKAKQWYLAHEIIFQHLAPDAVINDNLDYLHELLMQFENPDLHKNVKVPNWSNQGQIFLDFIDINEKFKSLKTLETEADIEARWKNLQPQLADLCSRINLLPCPTPKHRLCQSEIAQNLACLVRGVLLVCPILNPCLIIKIALERLPLPQEFAQQELRSLLDTLVGDLSKPQLSNTEHMIVK